MKNNKNTERVVSAKRGRWLRNIKKRKEKKEEKDVKENTV